jgi:hypothetical protein
VFNFEVKFAIHMNTKYTIIAFWLLSLPLCDNYAVHAQGVSPGDFAVIILTEKDEGIEFRREWINDGASLKLKNPSIISVIMPLSEGKSANLVRPPDREGTMVLTNTNGSITISFHAADGKVRNLPPVKHSDLYGYRTRVNVIAGDGTKKAFRIDRYTDIYTDNGPVLDLFGGMIPMEPGDYSITLETAPMQSYSPVTGEVKFTKADEWMVVEGVLADGQPARFIWDTGSTGGLVILEDILPPGSSVTPLKAISYSAEGIREEKGKMQGAAGTVDDSNFLGSTVLPAFTIGSMLFEDIEANVLKSFPDFLSGMGISGIIGMELIKRSGILTITGLNAPEGMIRFQGEEAACADTKGLTLYFQPAGGLLFTEGTINGIKTDFILDTGARKSILNSEFQAAHDLPFNKTGDSQSGGISGKTAASTQASIPEFTVGGKTFHDEPFTIIEDLAVTKSIGLQTSGAILGMSFFSQFKTCCIDFDSGKLFLGK